jgi:single-strand DNA-binding protein
MYTSTTVAGRLGSDPDMKYMPDGTAVSSFSLAANVGFGENKKTIWFRCSAWRKQAELANQYLSKGSKVLVVGELKPGADGSPRTFTRGNGEVAASFELTVNSIVFLESKKEGNGNAEKEQTNTPEMVF